MALSGSREDDLEKAGLLAADHEDASHGADDELKNDTQVTLLELSNLTETEGDEELVDSQDPTDDKATSQGHTEDDEKETDNEKETDGKKDEVAVGTFDAAEDKHEENGIGNNDEPGDVPESQEIETKDVDSQPSQPLLVDTVPSKRSEKEPIRTDVISSGSSTTEPSTSDSALSSPSKDGTNDTVTPVKERPSALLIPDRDQKKHRGKRKEKKEKSFSITSPSNLNPSSPLSDKQGKKSKAINVAVFVKEGTAKLLMLEKGKQTTAGEIKKMMIDNLSLPSVASTVFAVWLTSPYLELQLKGHHVPFWLRKQWPELLRKFTMVTDDDIIENDEPVLVFQRNAFLSTDVEKRITDDKIIRRLYEEAKHNILKGKYPVPNCDGEMLGGFVARLDNGKFDPENHKIGYFRNALPSYLPQSCRGKWFTRSVSVEQKLLEQYNKASDRCDDPIKLYRLFLEYCWTLPFYGCTFFKGKVEQQSKINEYWPWKGGVVNVYIGINRQGITIFKENRKEILLTLSYDDLSWDYVPSKESGVLDSFCVEFDTIDDSGRRLAKQLQIFSPQSVMMDAMVDSCVNEMNRLKIPKSPTTPADGDGNRLLADEESCYRSLHVSTVLLKWSQERLKAQMTNQDVKWENL